jgi:SAM-dependent methyltransferase
VPVYRKHQNGQFCSWKGTSLVSVTDQRIFEGMEPSSERSQSCNSPSERVQLSPNVQPQRPPSDFRLAHQLIDARYPQFFEQDKEPLRDHIFQHLDFLRATYPDLNEVRGRRILDLACGSTCYEDNPRAKYDPWMSRLLSHLGAQAVGIDLAAQRGENFESHIADLTVPDSLSFLKSSSFDAVYVSAFPTRKAINHLMEKGFEWPSMRENLLAHIARCLKPDGKIIRQFSSADEELVSDTIAKAAFRRLSLSFWD